MGSSTSPTALQAHFLQEILRFYICQDDQVFSNSIFIRNSDFQRQHPSASQTDGVNRLSFVQVHFCKLNKLCDGPDCALGSWCSLVLSGSGAADLFELISDRGHTCARGDAHTLGQACESEGSSHYSPPFTDGSHLFVWRVLIILWLTNYFICQRAVSVRAILIGLTPLHVEAQWKTSQYLNVFALFAANLWCVLWPL